MGNNYDDDEYHTEYVKDPTDVVNANTLANWIHNNTEYTVDRSKGQWKVVHKNDLK